MYVLYSSLANFEMNTLGMYLEMHKICMYLDMNTIGVYFKMSTICRDVCMLHASWDSYDRYVFRYSIHLEVQLRWILYLKKHTYYTHLEIHITVGMHLEMNTTSETQYTYMHLERNTTSRDTICIHLEINILGMHSIWIYYVCISRYFY